MESIIRHSLSSSDSNFQVSLIISNISTARGLQRAAKYGIKTEVKENVTWFHKDLNLLDYWSPIFSISDAVWWRNKSRFEREWHRISLLGWIYETSDKWVESWCFLNKIFNLKIGLWKNGEEKSSTSTQVFFRSLKGSTLMNKSWNQECGYPDVQSISSRFSSLLIFFI